MMSHAFTRRLITVPAVAVTAVLLIALIPIWLPVALVADLVRAPKRMALTRLLAFGVAWSWLEVAGVAVSSVLWITGQARRMPANYALQRWWASRIMRSLGTTLKLRVEIDAPEVLTPGPILLVGRHASLADSLVSAWMLGTAGLHPRYVMKRELLIDPCLDIVGNRLPNYFVDREATDSAPELAAITKLSSNLTPSDAAVIFPEGTRANPVKRERALHRIGARDPERAEALTALQHLLPPRPAGAAALLAGAPDADVVTIGHVGFEGFDSFGGILRRIPFRDPVVIHLQRTPRAAVGTGDGFIAWLDREWLRVDAWVDDQLTSRRHTGAA